MADNDWFVGMDEDEFDSTPPEGTGKEAHRVLPRLLIESVAGKEGIMFLSIQTGFCLIVEVPSADWVGPVHSAIRQMGGWDFHQAKGVVTRGRTQDALATKYVVQALATGGRISALPSRQRYCCHRQW